MNSIRPSKNLCITLILVLLSTSSFAVETAQHSDSHGSHDFAAPSQAPQQHDHSMHSGHADKSETVSHQAQNHDDCVCDELCCVSSMNFTQTAKTEKLVSANELILPSRGFYQSIDLDLLLPPPNA